MGKAKKENHSPGQWLVDSRYPNWVRTSCGVGIAMIEKSNANKNANALLISAAPDLLEALQGCISYRNWQIAQGEVRVPLNLQGTFKRAKAAIAKATGAK